MTDKNQNEALDPNADPNKKAGALANTNRDHCAGRCSGTAQVWAAECVIAKTATGVYTITCDRALAAADGCFMVTMEGVGTFSLAHTSDTVKTLSTFAVDGTTAADKAFNVRFLRRPGA
jgi:hypothetical protein